MDEKSASKRKPTDADGKSAEKQAARDQPDQPGCGAARPNPLEGLLLRREVRIGMGVLAVLVLILGYVFVSKINEADDHQTTTADASDAETPAEDAAPSHRPPTVVTASTHDSPNAFAPSAAPEHRESVYATDAARHDMAPPNPSYLPRRNPVDTSTHSRATLSATDIAANDAAASPADSTHDAPTSEVRAAASDGSKYGRYTHEAPDDDVSATDTQSRPNATRSPEESVATAAADAPPADGTHAGADDAASADAAATDAAARGRNLSKPTVVADAVESSVNGRPEARSTDANPVAAQPLVTVENHGETIADTPNSESPSEHTAVAEAPAAPTETPRNRTYVTIEGDTPASIAEAHYQDPRFAAALMAYNGVEIAADVALTPGGEVLIPQRAMLEREFARLIPAGDAREQAAIVADARGPVAVPDARRAAAEAHSERHHRATDIPAAQRRAVGESDIAGHPSAESPVTAKPDDDAHARPAATRVYTVAQGETVYDIARRELGRVSRWREILQLNDEQLGGDIDAVEPGMKLVLPEDGRSSVARQRGELLWR